MRRPKPKGARAFGELMGYLTSSLFFIVPSSRRTERPASQPVMDTGSSIIPSHFVFPNSFFVFTFNIYMLFNFYFFSTHSLFSHLIFTCYLTIIQHYKFTQQHAEYHLNTFIFLFHTHGNARGIHLVLYKRTHVDPMSPLHETEPIEFG